MRDAISGNSFITKLISLKNPSGNFIGNSNSLMILKFPVLKMHPDAGLPGYRPGDQRLGDCGDLGVYEKKNHLSLCRLFISRGNTVGISV